MADTLELLNFNNKQENDGTNNRGRLTANEFNQAIDAINSNTTSVYALKAQLAGLSLSVQDSEKSYEALASKDDSTIYFVLEE
jgi:hypothetical protein